MVANVKTAPVPPVPQYKNVLDAQGRFVSLEWLQWFVSVRDKINVINDLLVNLGLFTGGVPNIGPGGTVSAATTDDVPEGAVNKYFTETRVLETILDGLTISPNSPIVDTDNIIEAFGKLQAQINAISGGGGALEYLSTVTVSGSAATSISISGLDLTADHEYLLRVSVVNATGSTATLSMFYNGDTTPTHYYNQITTSDGTSTTSARANTARAVIDNANECAVAWIYIRKDIDGKPRAVCQMSRDLPSAMKTSILTHIWKSATNVTSLALTSDISNALDIGSYVAIYKLNT